jgi:hypothetical protein
VGKDHWGTKPRRWGRRLFIAAGTVLVGSGGLLLLVLWFPGDRFDAKIQSYQARGEPILPQDFNPPEVPDEHNGALVYRKAADALTAAVPDEDRLRFNKEPIGYLPLSVPQRALIRDIVAQSAEPLRLMRVARGMPEINWNIRLVSPVSPPLPRIDGLEPLEKLTRAAALDAFDRGAHAAAVEYLLDLAALARAMDQLPPMLITHMLSNGHDARVAETVLSIPPDLAAEAEAPARQLVTALFDTKRRRDALARMWQGERMMQADAVRQLAAESAFRGAFLKLDVVRLMEFTDQVAAASLQPTLPSAMSIMPAIPSSRGVRRFTHPLSTMMAGSLVRTVEREAQATTLRRAAATALAIRLYAIDHGGALPPALIDLVPRYLPVPPRDPFSVGNGEFLYVPSGDAPKIYSVGKNGVDDGASENAAAAGQPARSRWECLDYVFHLKRQVPPAFSVPPEAD